MRKKKSIKIAMFLLFYDYIFTKKLEIKLINKVFFIYKFQDTLALLSIY